MNPSNYSVISFPALGIELNPPRGFSIGPLYIHFYGVIIACGLILAVVYACRRSREAGLTEDSLLDGVLWITPFSIVCDDKRFSSKASVALISPMQPA